MAVRIKPKETPLPAGRTAAPKKMTPIPPKVTKDKCGGKAKKKKQSTKGRKQKKGRKKEKASTEVFAYFFLVM